MISDGLMVMYSVQRNAKESRGGPGTGSYQPLCGVTAGKAGEDCQLVTFG
jgi:hypothetical protein